MNASSVSERAGMAESAQFSVELLTQNAVLSTGDQYGLGSEAVVVIGYDRKKGDFYPPSQPGGLTQALTLAQCF
jgi:hypothetical protein